MKRYTIGKSSRFQSDDIVTAPPYEMLDNRNLYGFLRSHVWRNRELAEHACVLANEFNPVGFVVLVIEE